MIFSSSNWLQWAALFMPENRKEWLKAMTSEMEQIVEPQERQSFAFGCFRAALLEWPRSRRGLSQLSRMTGATFLTMISLAGIFQSYVMLGRAETAAYSKIIFGMCCVYICAAVFMITSLKNLRAFTLAGFSLGALVWTYCQFWVAGTEALPKRFLTAVSFEATGMMFSLFIASVFLGWLYDSERSEIG